jgi:hypothetical protein
MKNAFDAARSDFLAKRLRVTYSIAVGETTDEAARFDVAETRVFMDGFPSAPVCLGVRGVCEGVAREYAFLDELRGHSIAHLDVDDVVEGAQPLPACCRTDLIRLVLHMLERVAVLTHGG